MAASVGVAQDFHPEVREALADTGGVGVTIDAQAVPAARLLADGDTVGSGTFRKLDDAIVERLTRSEEHTSELQSLMRISYAVFCLKKKKQQKRANSEAK